MIKWYIVFMLLAPDGTLVDAKKTEVSTKEECYGAEIDRKLDNGLWFVARCANVVEH